MKRKYPAWFFVFGLFQNLVRYFFIGLTGVALLAVSRFGIPLFKIIGLVVLAGYDVLCIVEQIIIRSACLKVSDNPEFDRIMDAAFGMDNEATDGLSASQRMVDHVNRIVREHTEEARLDGGASDSDDPAGPDGPDGAHRPDRDKDS